MYSQVFRLRSDTVRHVLKSIAVLSYLFAFDATAKLASLSFCADQWLLYYDHQEDIAGFGYTSSDDNLSPMAEKARQFPVLHANIEDILAQNVTKLILDQYVPAFVTHIFKRDHIKTVRLNETGNPIFWASNLEKLMSFGLSFPVNAPKQAQKALETVKELFQSQSVLIIAPRGYALGTDHPAMQWLTWAGLRSWKQHNGWSYKVEREELLHNPPDIIILEKVGNALDLSGQMIRDMELSQGLHKNSLVLGAQSKYWNCPGPWTIQWLQDLRQAIK